MSVIREGVIVGGEYSGWKVLIDDDRCGDTGGCYMYLKKSDDEGFDYWFECEAGLAAQLADFDVDWMS
ncbi:hypothetical protein [Pseudomonas sichuanensis]|uniref:hypothetical protein n=1 Tax=Pseudomonas sichuanensis TaxID=2213015 RepID=UPI00215FA17A|nr:hypothetical protein [Pseudomonas sichuanensis]UVL87247.1 hypothetical protein LOY51_15745 [Pseudomonas sichuanensis]